MPGDEQKSINRAENQGYINCISRTTTRRGINKIPKCFSCPSDCKELSKETKRSIYDSNQAMADLTTDLRQQLADHEADKDKCDTKMLL